MNKLILILFASLFSFNSFAETAVICKISGQNIYVFYDVNKKNSDLLCDDLKYLETISKEWSTFLDKRIVVFLDDLKTPKKWALTKTVLKLVLGEKQEFNVTKDLEVKRPYKSIYPNYDFLNSDDYSALDKKLIKETKSRTLMSNIGCGIYLTGKGITIYARKKYPTFSDIYFTFKLDVPKESPIIKRFDIVSPRAGMIQIGKDLYKDERILLEDDPTSVCNRIFRLSILIHEARHSDGNGVNAGFPHPLCPDEEGSNLSNLPACDKCSNGAYATELKFLNEFKGLCKDKKALAKMNENIVKFTKRTAIDAQPCDEEPEFIKL